MLRRLVFCLAFFALAPHVFAQQLDSVQHIKEVKVNASKERPSLRGSQKADTLSFLRTSSYNVADAIRNFAGVIVKDYGGIGGLKTVSVRSLGASHTGVLLDGMAISNVQTGQIDLGKLSLDNVESIGLYQAQPDDLLSNARAFSYASVVVIKTKQPNFEAGRNNRLLLKYTAGSFGLHNPALQYDQKLSKKWVFSLNSAYQKAKGDYQFKVDGDGSDTLAVRKNSAIENLQVDVALHGKIGESGKLTLRGNYYNSERGLPNAVIYYNPTGRQTLWNKDFFTQAQYQQQLGDAWALLASVKYSRNYTRYNDPAYLNLQGQLDNRYTEKEYYQSIATTYKASEQLSFNYAADLFFNTLHTNLYGYAYPTRSTLLQVLGGRYRINNWIVEGNILHTYIKEKVKSGKASPEKSIFSPTLALAYQATANLTLRTFYKDVYRYPTFNDLYYTNFGNRKLNPERAKQYSLGYVFEKYRDSKIKHFLLSTDFYYNQISDKIVGLPNKDLFIWTMYNLGKVAIYGADFKSEAGYQINQKSTLQISLNYTYQLGLNKSDPEAAVYNNQIPYTPKHTVALNVGVQQARWSVFYNQIFSSDRYYSSDNSRAYLVKGFSVSDVSACYNLRLYNKPLILSAELNNVFNQNYYVVRSFPMPGTSIRLTIKTII